MVLRWAWLLTLYWTLCGGCKIRGILRTKYQTPLSLSRAITSPTARSSWKGRRCLLCSNLARNEVAEPAMEDRIRSDSMSRVIVKAQQVFYDALVTWSQWDSFKPQFLPTSVSSITIDWYLGDNASESCDERPPSNVFTERTGAPNSHREI